MNKDGFTSHPPFPRQFGRQDPKPEVLIRAGSSSHRSRVQPRHSPRSLGPTGMSHPLELSRTLQLYSPGQLQIQSSPFGPTSCIFVRNVDTHPRRQPAMSFQPSEHERRFDTPSVPTRERIFPSTLPTVLHSCDSLYMSVKPSSTNRVLREFPLAPHRTWGKGDNLTLDLTSEASVSFDSPFRPKDVGLLLLLVEDLN